MFATATLFAGFDIPVGARMQIGGDGSAPVSTSAWTGAVAPENALRPGERITVDAGPAIRRILASGRPLRLTSGYTYVVRPDPASAIGNGGYAYSIKVPSGARIIGDGGVIKQADNAPAWCRTVSFQDAGNFAVAGTLRVDANGRAALRSNEHMHGIFFFNSHDFQVEALESINARGDNVYIGGTDNSRGTRDGNIGKITAITAGRKNLVAQAFDNIFIGDAFLDNRLGGAQFYGGKADETDGNSLDVEPDNFSGSLTNRMTINNLHTIGAGNDFSAGTGGAAWAMQVTINRWQSEIISRHGVPWLTANAIRLNVGDMTVHGIMPQAEAARLFYQFDGQFDRLSVNGKRDTSSSPFIVLSRVGPNAPRLRITSLSIEGDGIGIENRDASLQIGQYRARTGGAALFNRGLVRGARAETSIGTLDLLNVGVPDGGSYAVAITGEGNNPQTKIDHIRFRDNRPNQLKQIIYVATPGLPAPLVGSLDNPTRTVPVGRSSLK